MVDMNVGRYSINQHGVHGVQVLKMVDLPLHITQDLFSSGSGDATGWGMLGTVKCLAELMRFRSWSMGSE
ncbi:CIC11C00000004799 [Sungouiella intermedia]|uniref:CIC11C00000004799 n=1 Tax=Sungouiella intermedia TaxID=45354 RepID=A0A1L0BG23_9ASCO|nr:CIC11C00000004799 [[Candida] intermedia]